MFRVARMSSVGLPLTRTRSARNPGAILPRSERRKAVSCADVAETNACKGLIAQLLRRDKVASGGRRNVPLPQGVFRGTETNDPRFLAEWFGTRLIGGKINLRLLARRMNRYSRSQEELVNAARRVDVEQLPATRAHV